MSSHDTPIRHERDSLGTLEIPRTAYYGIHTMRAVRNFPFSGYNLPRPFIKALAQVKQACAETNKAQGYLEQKQSEAIIAACKELESGALDEHIIVDAFQGGAGTSTNMNVNEVLANRAIEILGGEPGDYDIVHPIHHVNMHQSTNDVYPTAFKVATLSLLTELEKHVAKLQEVLQAKEDEFRDVVKVGRTELTDAVPMTLGMTFGAFADAIARDRWRIFKCRERIKKVNLGGTAIGTGLGAPRDYVLKVTESLRHICGLPVSRAENLLDATQNMDAPVEVSGMLKAYAANLMKIASDIRLMSSGPAAGLGEITLPALQSGSSIMAGKINPVMPEAITQVALRVMGNDQTLGIAAGMGQLELNHLMPMICHTLLESLTLLVNATGSFSKDCIAGIEANAARCSEQVDQSNALATVLVPVLGYAKVEKIVADAKQSGRSVSEEIINQGIASRETINTLLSPRRLCKMGYTPDEFDGVSKT